MLVLQNFDFYGEIPKSFKVLRGLQVLDLSQNNLNGSITRGIGLEMTKLVSMDLSQNMLSGSFPSDICNARALVELSLHGNSFSCSVPESISNCNTLQRIQVQNSMFSGNFPSGLWPLSDIVLIRVENNKFSGEVPDQFGVSSQLEQVQIDNRKFTARIPPSLGRIHSIFTGGVVHSFTGSAEDRDRLLSFDNIFIGVNGCSLKTAENMDVVRGIPTEKMMIETDAPYCEIKNTHAGIHFVKSTWPSKRKEKHDPDFIVKGRNEPCLVRQVLEVVASCKGINNIDQLGKTVYHNSCRLFFPHDLDTAADELLEAGGEVHTEEV